MINNLTYERAEEINKLACSKCEMPDGMNLPEQQLFQTLRSLYYQYSAGFINREAATSEKKQLIESFAMYQLYFEANRKSAKLVAVLGERLSDCYKNKNSCPVCKAIADRWGQNDYGNEQYEFESEEK